MKKDHKPGEMFDKFQKKRKMMSNPNSRSNYEKAMYGATKSGGSNGIGVGGVMKKKNFIQKAIKKPGALHKELGIKKGNKIPAKILAKAAKKGGKLGQRARFAETLKGLKHKKSMKKKSEYAPTPVPKMKKGRKTKKMC